MEAWVARFRRIRFRRITRIGVDGVRMLAKTEHEQSVYRKAMPQKTHTTTPSERRKSRGGKVSKLPGLALFVVLTPMCLMCGLLGSFLEDPPAEVSKSVSEKIEELEEENSRLKEGVERMYSRGETNSVSYNLTTRRILQNSLMIRDLGKERGY